MFALEAVKVIDCNYTYIYIYNIYKYIFMQYHILVAFIALRVIFLRIKGYPVVSFTTHGYPRGSRCSIRLEKSLNRRLRRPRPTVPAYTAGNPPQIMFHLDFTSIYSIYIYTYI